MVLDRALAHVLRVISYYGTKRQRNTAHRSSYSVSIRFVITVLCIRFLSISY